MMASQACELLEANVTCSKIQSVRASLAGDDQKHPALWVGLGKLLALHFIFMHASSLQFIHLKDGGLV